MSAATAVVEKEVVENEANALELRDKISDSVKDIAATIRTILKDKELTLDDKGTLKATALKEKGVDVFIDTLPEGLTAENVTAVMKHVKDVTAAATLVAGELGVNKLKEKKELEGTQVEFGNKDITITVRTKRSRTFPIPGTSETKETHGHTSTNIDIHGNAEQKKVLKYIHKHAKQELLTVK